MAAEINIPKIVLTPLERSHHFGRRECVATEPLKVGRSVDRRRISPNNLIFDCRVLSRNHALMWYENGKFYIKDTKSSNGTFVNENRLSASSEESGPVELKSRDVVQFGVNVNVDKKVTHGCIIATVKLYMNDIEVPGHEPPAQQALHIIQAALAREQELENKLASMQGVLNVARELATDSMIAIVKEDELMSRLEMLENQLHVYARNASEDELKKQLAMAYEEKHKNELASKDSLRNILQEKLECVSRLNQLQRDYDKAEQECQKYRTLYDTAKLERSQEVAKLEDKVKTTEKERKELETKLTEEKQSLATSLESIQAEADFTKEELEKTKARLSETQEELVELKISAETERQRKAKGLLTDSTEVPPGTEDPPGSVIPLGTVEDPLVPPGTEDQSTGEGLETVSQRTPHDEEEVSEELVEISVVAASMNGTTPIKTPVPKPPSPFERKETLMASMAESVPEPVLSDTEEAEKKFLEAELRISQGKVKQLEEQLCAISSSGGSTEGTSTEDMQMIARRLSDTAIAKGQVEVLENSLREAVYKIEQLQGSRLSPQSVDATIREKHATPQENTEAAISALKKELSTLQDDVTTYQSRLQSCDLECKKMQEANERLEGELSKINERYTVQLAENIKIKTMNKELMVTNETLERRIDEQKSVTQQTGVQKVCSSSSSERLYSSRSLATLRRIEEEEQHVRILTIIALVSIGVALASWLM